MISVCANIFAIVVAGVFRYSTEGEECAKNAFPFTDGTKFSEQVTTFADHGELFEKLFIVQVTTLPLYYLFLAFFSFLTIKAAIFSREINKPYQEK